MKTELKCKSRNLSSSFQLCCSLALLQKSRNPSELLSSVKLRYWVKRFPRSFPASEVFDGQCWQMKPMIPRAEDPGETIWPCLPALKQDPWEESNQAEQREHSSFFSVFFFFFLDVDHFKSLYWVCFHIASVYILVFWLWGMWGLSSLTRDGTHTSSTGRQSLKLQGPSRDLPGSPKLSLFWTPGSLQGPPRKSRAQLVLMAINSLSLLSLRMLFTLGPPSGASSHLCPLISILQMEVSILDDFQSGTKWGIGWAPFVHMAPQTSLKTQRHLTKAE